jgi:hypothetical protein
MMHCAGCLQHYCVHGGCCVPPAPRAARAAAARGGGAGARRRRRGAAAGPARCDGNSQANLRRSKLAS